MPSTWLNRGEVDMMGGFLDDGYAADGQQLAITESFASLNEVVFRNKLASSGETVFAQIEGRDGTDGVEASEVVHYRTYEDCLEAVNSGRADATSMPRRVCGKACSSTLVQQHHAGNLRAS